MIREKRFYKTFATLTLSLALQNLLTYSVNLMDNVMLGAYSETALSGAALCNQFQFLLQMLVMGRRKVLWCWAASTGEKGFQADSPHYRRGSSLRGGDGRRDVSCGAVFPGTGTGTADE